MSSLKAMNRASRKRMQKRSIRHLIGFVVNGEMTVKLAQKAKPKKR